MRIENAVPTIILVCGLVQITLGISFFLDYETLMGLSLSGVTATTLSFMIVGILYSRSKNKGEVFDERFRTQWVSIIGLCYVITNIGIALLISSVFYDVGSVKSIDVLTDDIVGFLFLGWGIPLVLFALTEFTEGRKV
tara:strand:- start:2396 stop:2809 length:414 start_codon:yes stop_codon:yes gene_type:complete